LRGTPNGVYEIIKPEADLAAGGHWFSRGEKGGIVIRSRSGEANPRENLHRGKPVTTFANAEGRLISVCAS
jgi:hypothetical protein